MSEQVRLYGAGVELRFACREGERPRLVYWGSQLPDGTPSDTLARLTTRQHAPGSPASEVPVSLLPGLGEGYAGPPAIEIHRGGQDWAADLRVAEIQQLDAQTVILTCKDENSSLHAVQRIALDDGSGIATFQIEIVNTGAETLDLNHCAVACLPMDSRLSGITSFSGRWANEFQTEDIPVFTGTYLRENRKGRTSHDVFPGLILKTDATTEQSDLCVGAHLGWSGNHRTRLDRLSDGRTILQMGELFFPGEMRLTPGAHYRTPVLHLGLSEAGLSDLSQRFHRHVRQSVMDGRIQRKPRPVHYNTWEAVYFDHDQDKLFALAEKAASLGVERFILDDGWFGSRRDEASGLGDWFVSDQVYPDGLAPLIRHVEALGMEFGLWVEPEMVNPDSQLYRAHPDWVLQAPGVPQIPSRHQYVLDLTRSEVSAYLFDKLDGLLREHSIAYLKWDMNRDIHHPGNQYGQAVTSAQTRAVYALIDRLRAAHPEVEIESCASGGGRADYGVLSRTDRIWTSDSNDALDRQRIQRGASHFFPLEVLGAHVGPAKCHITGRRLSMPLRVATALFGHMGLELNLLDKRDLETLQAGIALYKQHRALLHSGDFIRLDTPAHVNSVGVVSTDQTEALFSWCNLTGHRETLPGRIHFDGLDPDKTYRLRCVWPQPARSVSAPSVLDAADLTGAGLTVTGAVLQSVGLQAPLLHPETCLIFHLLAE